MTAPTGPTPAAPAPVPAPPTPAGPAPTPATPPVPTWSPDSLPPEGKAWLDQQIAAQDKKARLGTAANAASEAEKAVTARMAQALGLAPTQDGPPTVESLAKSLTDMQTAFNEVQERAQEAEVVAQITRTASRLGANADTLLDSRRVVDQLNAIEADSQQAYDAAVEQIISAAIAANPGLKSGAQPPAVPPASGGDFAGAGGNGSPITEAQLAQMSQADVAKAFAEGKLNHLL